ncbi:MAG: hypothetical protein IJX18_01230 [Clostridia bacterium]|nr:hypothetical protein [Clostridia bacterium]
MERKSAIYQMFYGSRGTCNDIPHSKEYFDLLGKVSEQEDEVDDALQKHPEILSLLTKTRELIDDMQEEALYCHFAEGVRFGFQLALDIFQEN